jgi:hypothetical protein
LATELAGHIRGDCASNVNHAARGARCLPHGHGPSPCRRLPTPANCRLPYEQEPEAGKNWGLRSAGCFFAAAAVARRCLLPTGRRPRPSAPAGTAFSSLSISRCHDGQVWSVGEGAGCSVSQGRQNQGGSGGSGAEGGKAVGSLWPPLVLVLTVVISTGPICWGSDQLGLLAVPGARGVMGPCRAA